MRNLGIVVAVFLLVSTANAEEEAPRYWDYNGDGREDVRYNDVKGGLSYIEYLDRNFDGEDDQYTQYDSKFDWPVGGFSDDDYDGTFETRHIYKDASIFAAVTDSNDDGYYDIAHYYDGGMLSKSLRYSSDGGKPSLITVTYQYDFPVSNSREETDQTPSEFYESLKSAMPPSQSMPSKPSN